MAKKGESSNGNVTKPVSEIEEAPQIAPPGRVHKGGHGLQTGPLRRLAPLDRLRMLLSMSVNVEADRVCDEAADEIEMLRKALSKK